MAASVAKSIGIVLPVFIVENGNSIVLWLLLVLPNLHIGIVLPVFIVENGNSIVLLLLLVLPNELQMFLQTKLKLGTLKIVPSVVI